MYTRRSLFQNPTDVVLHLCADTRRHICWDLRTVKIIRW